MAAQTMQAAVVCAPGRLELHELPIPQPKASQVRLRIEGCGVCGSNLPLWEGRPWFEYPRDPGSPGHEAWGTIDKIGADVPQALLGQRVAALSYRAFAQYDVAEARQVVVLPASLADEPFPGEALACVMNIYRRCGVAPGQRVAVIGAGFIGCLLMQLATADHAHVLAVSRRPYALDLALRSGAREVFALGAADETQDLVEQVRRASGGRGCDVVIEAVGEQTPLDVAAQITAVRGRLVIAGYHQEPRQVDMQLWNWRGLDVINAHERAPERYVQGMREALDAQSGGRIDPTYLYTHAFELPQLSQALTGLKQRPAGMLKTWVKPC